MGQKTNAQIFRLGIKKKIWETKYIEKNLEESSLYLYKTVEIQKYLNRFFALYKIKVHNCKISYSAKSLRIFISLYTTIKTIPMINKINTNKKKLFKIYDKFEIRKKNKKNIFSTQFSNKQNFTLMEFQEFLLESLSIYTKKKVNIFVTFQNLNDYKQLTYNQNLEFKNIIKQLSKFSKNSFFKEALNLVIINISKRKSAKLLADFISDQFRLNQLKADQTTMSKKDNHFLGFLKLTIKLLITSQISCITGIKIVIKGRFNKAPRAKSMIIQFGKFSLQSLNEKIDYFQSTAYTANGTFGIKVWICEN